MEEHNNSRSHISEDSLLQSNAAQNIVTVQGDKYVKKKFRRQLYIISLVFSSILLAAFLGVFIYYLQNQMLGAKDIIVPNHYRIRSAKFTPQSVTLYAEYQGDQEPEHPNIYQFIQVNISLQNGPSSTSQTNNNFLRVDIQQDESNSNIFDKDYNIKSVKFIKENQLDLSDVDLGPFDLEYSNQGSKLAFIISRNSTGEKIFDTLDFDILISQYYSTIGTFIPNGQFYGLGERRTNYFSFENVYKGLYKNCTYGYCNRYRFWNRNPRFSEELFDIGLGNGQLSGYQPLYLIQEESSNYSIVYIENSFSGLEVDYYQSTSNAQYTEALVFQNFNNKISFSFFLGDTNPETVIKQYHDYIGHFNLIPFWALGYHHSKTFLSGSQNLKSFLETIQKLNLPIDGIWTNIEFTSNGNYFKLANEEIVKQITSMQIDDKIKWIPQIPSEISNSESCLDYINKGKESNSFIISNKTKVAYMGEGLSKISFFIDYNHVNASALIQEALEDLFNQVNFDGVWLNQNEPSTQLTGEFINNDKLDKSNGYFDTIYNFTDFNFNSYLLNIDALHYNQPDAPFYYNPKSGDHLYEKDLHSANGFMQSATIHEVMKDKIQLSQPFIISSSSRPGSGRYIAHSTGAIVNSWSVLQTSFIEIFNFQLYGIPFTGSNICPISILNENDYPSVSELCTRWYQAASVYPFIHSTQTFQEVDPFFFKDYSFLWNSVKESLQLRYSLLKHYYSLYVLKKGAGMVFKPVGFVFPQVANYDYFLVNANNTAMIGESLYVFTVMKPGDQTTNSTLVQLGIPPSLWVNLLDTHIQYKGPFSTKYNFKFEGSPLIFLREGHLILWQKINEQEIIRASLLGYSFVIKGVLTVINQNNLDIKYQAKGATLGILNYNDNENLKRCGKQGCELSITVDVEKVIITFSTSDTHYFEEGITIQDIQLSGVIKYNDMLLQFCQPNDIASQPYDYITVKSSLEASESMVVSDRQKSFKLKLSI